MSIVKRGSQRDEFVYLVRLRDPDGKVYNRTFRTKKEAQRWELDQRSQLARGGWIDPRGADTTMAEVAKCWLDANPSKRDSGWARDETIIRLHLLPALGRRPVGSITPGDIQSLVNDWVASGKAPRTIRRQYGVLRAVCNAAVANDLILRSPCRAIKLPNVEPLDRHLPSADDLAGLASALGDDAAIMWVGAVLGLRWGETVGLRVGCLDLLRGQLTVAEQQTRGRGGAPVSGPPKSSAGRRTLSLPDVLADMLSAHLRRRGLSAVDADALVFVAPHGGPVRYDAWRRRVWMPACSAAGLEGLAFHDLRRVNATVLVAGGVDVKTAQTRLGHSDPRLIMAIYAQATSAGDRNAADLLGDRLMPPPAADVRRRPRCPRARRAQDRTSTTDPLPKPPLTHESGRRDSNPRPQRPERCALTKLRYFPVPPNGPRPMLAVGARTTTLEIRRRSISATRNSQPSHS